MKTEIQAIHHGYRVLLNGITFGLADSMEVAQEMESSLYAEPTIVKKESGVEGYLNDFRVCVVFNHECANPTQRAIELVEQYRHNPDSFFSNQR